MGVPDDHYGEEVAAVVATVPRFRSGRRRTDQLGAGTTVCIQDSPDRRDRRFPPEGVDRKDPQASIDRTALKNDALTAEVPER